MPRPASGTAINRPDLGVMAYEHMTGAGDRGNIGIRVMPPFEVIEASGQYPRIPVEALLKVQETTRAPRSAYNRGDWEFEMGDYTCKEHGWEEPMDDVERALYRRFFDAEMVATQRAVDIILRNHERRVADMLMNTANACGSQAVAAAWSDAANATPYEDVRSARTDMRQTSGLRPTAMVMSEPVFENLCATDEIKAHFKPVQSSDRQIGMAQKQAILATYFHVNEILVGDAIIDTAKKGKAFSPAGIWGDQYVALACINNDMNLMQPGFGRTFVWTSDSGMLTTETYRDESVRGTIYRVRQYTDEAMVFNGANYLLTGVTS